MISTVTGSFTNFQATAKTQGDDFTSARIHFTAAIDSISTNNEQRDAHLRNGDFFDAEKYPELSFESTSVESIDDENFKLAGTLTMRGVSKPVALNVEFGGITQDPWGNTRAGFTVTGKIDRQDFGLSYGAVTETGGLLLGNEVKIIASVQLVKELVAEPA